MVPLNAVAALATIMTHFSFALWLLSISEIILPGTGVRVNALRPVKLLVSTVELGSLEVELFVGWVSILGSGWLLGGEPSVQLWSGGA